MAVSYAEAVRAGTMAAARIHRQLKLRENLESEGGSVDVFEAIHQLGIPLLVRPLRGLLGAYLSDPTPGILVTTERRLSIQRFTAAHELGHGVMGHAISLDDKSILRRTPNSPEPGPGFQETEADAFAMHFLMPKWLILSHCARQGWQMDALRSPHVIYQLSLRIGASYEATVRTLFRYALMDSSLMRELLLTKRRALKAELLGDYEPANYRGDVWLLTEDDAGTKIEGSRDDLFVLRVPEHSNGGYLWDFEELKRSGFVIVRDERSVDDELSVGEPVIRRITGLPEEPEIGQRGIVRIDERRPWAPSPALSTIILQFDLTGPENGLSRAERRQILQAA